MNEQLVFDLTQEPSNWRLFDETPEGDFVLNPEAVDLHNLTLEELYTQFTPRTSEEHQKAHRLLEIAGDNPDANIPMYLQKVANHRPGGQDRAVGSIIRHSFIEPIHRSSTEITFYNDLIEGFMNEGMISSRRDNMVAELREQHIGTGFLRSFYETKLKAAGEEVNKDTYDQLLEELTDEESVIDFILAARRDANARRFFWARMSNAAAHSPTVARHFMSEIGLRKLVPEEVQQELDAA